MRNYPTLSLEAAAVSVIRLRFCCFTSLFVGCGVLCLVLGLCTKSKKEGKDQESIQSSTTPCPGYQWESDNFTIRHHKRGPRGQPFPNR